MGLGTWGKEFSLTKRPKKVRKGRRAEQTTSRRENTKDVRRREKGPFL